MMRHRALSLLTAALLVTSLVGASGLVIQRTYFGPTTIYAVFTTATAIYPGDDVRVAGVKVGTITAMQPEGTQARLTMAIDHSVHIPADAKAIIVAQNLISARFVQLTPLYESGPPMAQGATITMDRTAIPVEWDDVKTQLTRLATDLGPSGQLSSSSLGRFIDSAADALDGGNGPKLRQTVAELSGAARILADNGGDVVGVIKNLQTFITALRASGDQIVEFQDRLASLSSVLNGGRSDLDAALTNLSQAIGDVDRFVKGTGTQATEQVRRLADVTQNLVDHRGDLEQVLHVTPTALANSYNMFDPRTGAASGVFVINDLANPVQFLCGEIAALQNVTASETGELCTQYLGPGLRKLNANYLPFPINPFLTSAPPAGQLIYSEPSLMPGADGGPADPAPTTPTVSAYTGAPGDTATSAPQQTPPSNGGPPTTGSLLLPAEGPPTP